MLTTESQKLFIALAEDAGNWHGQPLVQITKEQRGNLADLKKKGLIKTFEDEGCVFAIFTDEGAEYAAQFGHEVCYD